MNGNQHNADYENKTNFNRNIYKTFFMMNGNIKSTSIFVHCYAEFLKTLNNMVNDKEVQHPLKQDRAL